MKEIRSFVVDTRQMYNNFCVALYDVVSDGSNPFGLESHKEVILSLANGQIDGIRLAFKNGLAPFLVPELIKEIDQDGFRFELRIEHLDELIGVIIDQEIKF